MIIRFITIKVDNLLDSIKFYEEVLGFKEVKRIDHVENITMVFLQDRDGGTIELIYNDKKPKESDVLDETKVTFGISVESMSDTISLLKKHNLFLDKGPITTPGGEILAFMKDPNGVEIEFLEGFKI